MEVWVQLSAKERRMRYAVFVLVRRLVGHEWPETTPEPCVLPLDFGSESNIKTPQHLQSG
jgi:hypothetical protein